MAKDKKPSIKGKKSRPEPARTLEGRENQIIAAAMDLAYEQILDGTASSQVITHFLKLGSTKNLLELEKLRKETAVLEKKAENYETLAHIEDLYSEAIDAMRIYGGHNND